MSTGTAALPTLPPPPAPPAPPAPPRWPLRRPAAGPAALLAVPIVGVVAAAILPVDRPGLGWLLSGLTVAAAIVAIVIDARRSDGSDGSAPVGSAPADDVLIGHATLRDAAIWTVAALALLAVGVVRAADWVVVLCILSACVAAAVAVAGGRTTTGIALAVPLVPIAMLRALFWLRRGLQAWAKERRTTGSILRTAAACVVGLCLVAVFGALFSAADPAFAAVIAHVTPDLNADAVARWILVGGMLGAVTAGGAFLLVNPAGFGDVAVEPKRRLRRVEWALPVGLLLGVFALFVAVQAAVLFGGRRYVIETAGLTFAQYARRGFGQLLVVTMLTLIVLAVAARMASRDARADRILVRVMLGGLSVGALVVVASALWRMWVYEQAYGFTRLRIFVSAFELWLGVLFLLVLVAGVRLRAAWLPRAVLGAWVVTLLGLAALNPDRFIAEHNVARAERMHQLDRMDVGYLRSLSADAVPVLDRLPEPLRSCALGLQASELRADPDPWYSYNTARSAAADRLRDVTADDFCWRTMR